MSYPSLRFTYRRSPQTVDPAGLFYAIADPVYRDAPDPLLEAIRDKIAFGTPWREAVVNLIGAKQSWLKRIVTDASRTRWLEQHPPVKDSLVLDVGCGWGQWAVPAATTARVVALEPNPARLSVVHAIAAQEGRIDRMYFIGAFLEEVDFLDTKFDQAFCIGVLEWVPRFQPGLEPIEAQRSFLRKLCGALRPGGTCVIGIENRLGLKYLLGARDDHHGLAGISCLDPALAARRYQQTTGEPLRMLIHSRAEYDKLLREAGFHSVQFWAAFPDYKVPEAIVPLDHGAVDQRILAGLSVAEHHGDNGEPLAFQDELSSHYRSLALMGLAGQFAPSYFIVATR